MKNLNMFFRLSKVDEEKRLVHGIATAEVVDKSGEICDYETTKPYYKSWSGEIAKATDGKSVGNLRVMHTTKVAGVIKNINFNDDAKEIEIVAKIVDDAEWKMVLEGGYTGFSQGGKYVKSWKDKKDPSIVWYTAAPSEISIVDNPCVTKATFEVVKADGTVMQKSFKAPEPAEPVQGWQATDGSFHATKALAMTKNAELVTAAADAEDPLNKIVDDIKKALDDKDGGEPEPDPAADADPLIAAATELGKTLKAPELRKGMYEVSRAAGLLAELKWLCDSLEYEAAVEGDNSPNPAALMICIKQLAAFLVALVQEETAELTMGKAEGLDKLPESAALALADYLKGVAEPDADAAKALRKTVIEQLEKKGARHSKDDMDHLTNIHKGASDIMQRCMKMGSSSDSDADKAAQTEGLAKVATIEAENAALKKQMGDLLPELQKALARITALEKSPVPPKGKVFQVEKGHEVPTPGTEPVEATTVNPMPSVISPEDARRYYN